MVDDPDGPSNATTQPAEATTQPADPALARTSPDGKTDPDATAGYLTTQPGATATPRDSVAPDASSSFAALPATGYDLGGLIGKGGMGEVVEARDRRILRDVAVKRMKSRTPGVTATNRFLREARIQARLDHPAIVPVYELGVDPEGRPYFTMKRLAGRTMSDHLTTGTSLQRLLRAFVEVCFAIELAHERGVIHRDLKPSNIMLGNYGETYVLDWGIARVLAEEERADSGGDIDTLDEGTRTGALLGTFGYMSPEQARAEPIEFSSDIYSLGAILFEILTGESLHPRGREAIATTLAKPQQSPSARKPDRAIAPELDKVCTDALSEVAMQRPRARALAERVQRYLDGDRDVERRRALANELLGKARTALESPATRAEGLALAGRALALDPEGEAAPLVAKLVTEPPAVLPDDCIAQLDREALGASKERRRLGGLISLSVFVFIATIPLLSVKSWSWLIAFFVIHALTGGFMFLAGRHPMRAYLPISMTLTLTAAVVWSRIASPYMLVPVMMCAVLFGMSANDEVMRRRWILPLWAVVAVMLPLVLEWTGVLPSTVSIESGRIEVLSTMYNIRGDVELIALTAANLGFVLITAIYGVATHRIAARSKRELSIQNWQLQHLSRAKA